MTAIDHSGRQRVTVRPTFAYQKLVNAIFAFFIFCGMMSIIEPSPYDFAALLAMPIWFFGGFKVHRSLIPILFLWIFFEITHFLALMPYWTDADSRLYQLQSLYLFFTVVFFTIFFSERTIERAELCLKAFSAGAVVASIVGLVGYLNIAGLGAALTTVEGRVSGTFKDPNVLGSYLVLAAVYLMQLLLLGKARHVLITLVCLLLVLSGVFLSYSRGSWGAALGALIIMVVMAFITAETVRAKRRIVTMTAIAIALSVVALLGALSAPQVREFFFQRAAVTQEYDEGVTGRFGNQIRSIPMLLERPEGFGPLRFRLIFGLEPHNSYVGAFANGGWFGGFTWIAIVLTSCFIGFRLMYVASPYRRVAQVFFPSLFALLMQGFQIDVDHWRQVFLCFGAVWGIEAARLKWVARQNEKIAVAANRPAYR